MSVAVGRPKASSKLSKLTKQSQISTLQAETVEKPNILKLESVTIDHSKIATKSLKTKQKLIVTNQNTT